MAERYKPKPSFEDRAIAALGDDKAASVDIEALLRDCDVELAKAEHEATKAHEASLDPAQAPDKLRALEAVQLAQLTAARLKTLQPRLEAKLRQVLADEYVRRYHDRYHILEIKRDQAVARFNRVQELTDALVELFSEAEALDQEIHELHSTAPSGVAQRLKSVELVARNLESYSRDFPSLLKAVVLLSPKTGAQVWPPKQPPISSFMFGPEAYDYGRSTTGEWWMAGAEQKSRQDSLEKQQMIEAEIAKDRFYGKGPPT